RIAEPARRAGARARANRGDHPDRELVGGRVRAPRHGPFGRIGGRVARARKGGVSLGLLLLSLLPQPSETPRFPDGLRSAWRRASPARERRRRRSARRPAGSAAF